MDDTWVNKGVQADALDMKYDHCFLVMLASISLYGEKAYPNLVTSEPGLFRTEHASGEMWGLRVVYIRKADHC